MKRKKCKNTEYISDNHSYNIITRDKNRYWDEGLFFYPVKSKNTISNKKKRLLMYQVRKYKTWKHNRKTQYKIN